MLIGVLLTGCGPPPPDGPAAGLRVDTLSRYADGRPRVVERRRSDSLVERRTFRPTGRLRSVARAGSVRSYLDLHDLDSAAVLRDYLQGRWRNTSVDSSAPNAGTYYLFEGDQLTFARASGAPIETIGIRYSDNRMLETEQGMTVRAEILSFDSVRVTGLTLVRRPSESPPPPRTP